MWFVNPYSHISYNSRKLRIYTTYSCAYCTYLYVFALVEHDIRDDGNNTKWEDRFTGEERENANMDESDFIYLLMESRIIQAS